MSTARRCDAWRDGVCFDGLVNGGKNDGVVAGYVDDDTPAGEVGDDFVIAILRNRGNGRRQEK